jgi:SAM-dependent methyltransferase
MVYRAPREAEACPACGSGRLRELDLLVLRRETNGSRTGFISGCRTCGLVFVNPLPTAEELDRFYKPGGEWHAGRDDETTATAGQSHGTSWRSMFAPIRGELDVMAPPPGAAVLDFGCGIGKLLDSMKECGWQTWGIETATDVAFQHHGRLEAIPDTPSFDLIVCHHVLEHLTNPLALLRQFARAIRPGGFLLVSVPRLDTLPEHRDYSYVINARAHVTAYTWPCMQALLARTAWQPVAPPPDRVPSGAGRITTARLRVIARNVPAEIPAPASPLDAAAAAMREYHAGVQGRSKVERLGWYRLAARQAEARRRSEASARRAARRRMVM